MSMVFRVIKGIFKFLESLGRVLMVFMLIIFLGIIAGASSHKVPSAPDRYALIIHPHGQLVEQLSDTPISLSELAVSNDGPNETLLRELLAVIHAAASDAHVKALVIDASDLDHSGLSKLKQVTDAIVAFKASGKKVYAYARAATQEQYLLLASADEIMLDPVGEIELSGVAAYHLYFHEALDRLGVEINVFKVGTHKSYPEPYIRQDMSKEDREQTKALIEPLWAAYGTSVEQARHLKPGTVQQVVLGSVEGLKKLQGDDAQWALSNKLVTLLGSEQDFERKLIAEVGEDKVSHSFNAVDSDDYAAMHSDLLNKVKSQNIAVLVAAGDIVDGEAPQGQVGGESFARLLRQARFDDSVKAVVLRVDSPGGSMMASEIIRREVVALQEAHKPVVVSMGSVAASGGYYISMNADKIFAEPETITGSIGVFAIIPTFAKTLQKVGVASDGISTSPLAGMLNLERSLTPESKAVLQLGVEHAYHQFVALVAGARHKDYATLEPMAEGKVYLADEALKLGLVDQIGGLSQSIEAAAKLANLKDNDYGLDYREHEPTWREMLARAIRDSHESEAKSAATAQVIQSVLHNKALKQLRDWNDPKHLYVWCACETP